jgi:hypothetical protein
MTDSWRAKIGELKSFVSGFALLSMLAKIRHVRLSVCRLVVRVERLGPHWTDLHEINLNFFFSKNLFCKIQILLKSDKNTGCII